MNRKTASGLDLVGIAELNQLTDKQISMIFNRWWGLVIPDTAKECKTTLLPKTIEGKEDVGNWRPITIGNVLMRLYAKVWDKRLRANIKLDDRQKGSVPVHGCYENVKIIQNVMKQQRKRRREYNIVFLDLAKPFDSVSHQSLRNGLRKKGIPQTVVEGIMEMYYHSTTRISIGGRKTKRLNINSGVKQGCPLSPLLFNLIMDELLERLKKRKIVVEVDDELISVIAFADDLVLITEHSSHMAIALTECEQFFKEKGLKVNAKKSASLRVEKGCDRCTQEVVRSKHQVVGF